MIGKFKPSKKRGSDVGSRVSVNDIQTKRAVGNQGNELSLLDSTLNRSQSGCRLKVRPSTTTHSQTRLEISINPLTPTYSTATHSQQPSKGGGNESPKTSKKKKNALSVFEKPSRQIDYFSLKPLKSTNAPTKPNSAAMHSYDQPKKSGPPLVPPPVSSQHSDTKKVYLSGGAALVSPFQNLAIPHPSQLFIGRHSSIGQQQPLSSRTSQEADERKSLDLFSEPPHDRQAKVEQQLQQDWRSRYLRLEKQMKKQRLQFEKKEVSLRTEIIQLQQKLLFNE